MAAGRKLGPATILVVLLGLAACAPLDADPLEGDDMTDPAFIAAAVEDVVADATHVDVASERSGLSPGWSVSIDVPRETFATPELKAVIDAVRDADSMTSGHIFVLVRSSVTSATVDLDTAAEGLGFPWAGPGNGISVLVAQIPAEGTGDGE